MGLNNLILFGAIGAGGICCLGFGAYIVIRLKKRGAGASKRKETTDKAANLEKGLKTQNMASKKVVGFLDYKTGRRKDIDPETGQEVFVD